MDPPTRPPACLAQRLQPEATIHVIPKMASLAVVLIARHQVSGSELLGSGIGLVSGRRAENSGSTAPF
jgi:hypothetical protein